MTNQDDKMTYELLVTLGHKVGRFIINEIGRERKGEHTAQNAGSRIASVLTDLNFRLGIAELGYSTDAVIQDVLTLALGMVFESVNPWYEGVNNDDEFASALKEQDEE